MLASEGTFKELMQQDRQFTVPLYQRHYKWNRQQQSELWHDILEQYESLGDPALSTPDHFIGSIVTVELPKDPLRDFRRFRIVDGQQRLTTLSIAFAALRDVASQGDSDEFARLNAKYLVNSTEKEKTELWPRLILGDQDKAAYWSVLTDPSEVDPLTSVGAAYKFFLGEIERLQESGALIVNQLANAMGERLSLVSITVEPDERPHKIFESINATGVELTQSDLLRNYLFMALGDRTDAVYENYWRPLETSLGPSIEDLVRDDLQADGTFVKKDAVYRTHRQQLEPIAQDLDALEQRVARLSGRGQFYRFLVDAESVTDYDEVQILPETRSHLMFIRRWGAGTINPVAIRIFDLLEQGYAEPEQVANCFNYLESFLVRRHLAAVGTRALNRLFLSSIAVLNDSDPIDESLKRELSRDGHWPSDEAVLEGVKTEVFYGRGKGLQSKLVLERFETHLREEVAVDFDSTELSIEHILPQTMSDDWRKRLEDAGNDPESVFLRYGHTLGNLTLTGFNSELSNKLIERKQEIMSKSELKLNDPLSEVSQWGVPEIEDRADWLGLLALTIWASPIPGVVTPHEGFDWSRIDAAVESIPIGRWAAYGDLAALSDTAAMPAATHIASSPALTKAYRVFMGDGRISDDFVWTDPDDSRDVREVLASEGIEFDEAGRASQKQRLTPEELSELADGFEGGTD